MNRDNEMREMKLLFRPVSGCIVRTVTNLGYCRFEQLNVYVALDMLKVSRHSISLLYIASLVLLLVILKKRVKKRTSMNFAHQRNSPRG